MHFVPDFQLLVIFLCFLGDFAWQQVALVIPVSFRQNGVVRVFTVIYIFIGLFGYAAEKPSQSKQILRLIKSSRIPKAQLSVRIGYPNSSPLFQLNEDTLRVPASLTKIVTAATVLRLHARDRQKLPVTRLMSEVLVSSGILKGNLFLKGGGDPSFVSENMWNIVNEFRRTGVKTITGDIIVDDSLFDSVRFDASRRKKRVDRAYDAPVGAMSFNWNSVSVFVRPGTKAGTPAIVFAEPESDYLKVHGKIITSKSKTKLSVRRTNIKGQDRIQVSGTIALGSDEKVFYRAISDPARWSGYNLASFLKQRGITVQGKIKSGVVPENAVELAKYESKSLEEILRDMQKYSNNFVAEMLVKLVSSWSKQPGTIAHGSAVLRRELAELGWKTGEFQYINPSGLSRKNQFSAFQLSQILEKMQNDFSTGPEFVMALPKSGIDGTLKKRINNADSIGRVRAKTGYLSGVVGLAGYVKNRTLKPLTFVLIYNGSSNQDKKAKDLFDAIAGSLTLWNGQ